MEEIRYIEIVAQYQDMVYRIAFHDCRNSHDAEDVMQTVFMKLYQKNPEFDNEEHLKHWLIRVTMNECKRLIASPWKKRMEFFPEEEGGGHGQQDDADGYERMRERELLEQVFRLPRKYRVPIYLYYYEEYSVADIGDMLGKNPSTIQTWLSRARKKLKNCWRRFNIMNEAFPKEIYQKACERLTPSSGSLREVYAVKKPKKYPRLKRKAFAATAASVVLICSLSVGVLAASGTDIRQAAGEAVQQIAMVFKNVTVDQEASTPYETVLHAEDGTQITVVHEYGENGEYYVTLVYHKDSQRLGLTIGDKEIDITDQLKEKGVYTQDYTFEGEERRLTVTGTPEDPKLETEILIK